MQLHLVVTSPFGSYEAGTVITDADLAEELLRSHGERVVKIVPVKPTTAKED